MRMADNDYLGAARRLVREFAQQGITCPCCNQYVKVYRRKLTTMTAQALVLMYRQAGEGWVNLPALLGRKQADEAKARYWGLIQESEDVRDDGSKRAGWWRLTELGVRFVQGRARVPKYALIYNSQLVYLDLGETVDIREALGTRFHYDDLMANQ